MFLDVDPRTLQVRTDQFEEAYSERTRAVILAHTLGSPYDLDEVTAFTRRHKPWLIEECCDAVGATYKGRKVGTFGDLATVSFYPAHHITVGEDGCVLTDQPLLKTLESVLMLPEAVPGAEPSWFGFPWAVRPEAPFSREQLIWHLESGRVATRLLFGGNLVRQPAYRDAPRRVVGSLEGSNFVMRNVFWIGVYPGPRRCWIL